MKRYGIPVLIIAMLLSVMVGCSEKPLPTQAPASSEQATTVTEGKTTTENTSEATDAYKEVLAEVYAFVADIENKADPKEGFTGIWEAAKATGETAMQAIGYAFVDINGDAFPELLIGAFDKAEDAFTQNELYAVYTLCDGAPLLLLEGMSRSAYALNKDRTLYYQGSDGAAYSMFGTFHIEDLTLVCDAYYFSYPQEDDPQVIEYYYNELGYISIEDSQKLTLTGDEFWETEAELSAATAALKGTPLKALPADIIEKAMTAPPVPDVALLPGTWEAVSGMTDGYAFATAEEGIESSIIISDSDAGLTASYSEATEYSQKSFEATLSYQEELLYYDCGNDDWSVACHMISGDYGAEEEFYLTLTDENTLLLQHFFPFDGAQGVSYMTYSRVEQ